MYVTALGLTSLNRMYLLKQENAGGEGSEGTSTSLVHLQAAAGMVRGFT